VKSGRRAARDEWQKGNVGEEDGWQAIDENEDKDGRNNEGQKAVSMEWESREEGWEARQGVRWEADEEGRRQEMGDGRWQAEADGKGRGCERERKERIRWWTRSGKRGRRQARGKRDETTKTGDAGTCHVQGV